VVTQTDLLLGDGRTLHAYDALGIGQFAVMGHSGGAAHALACAALLPERVLATVCGSGLAPYHAEGLDWFAGMGTAGAAELRAAAEGRAALEDHLASAEYDPELFTPADHAALAGEWSWLLTVVEQAMNGGLGGMVDDDLACVAPWGFDPAQVRPPVLFLHAGQDRMVPSSHGQWLARRTPSAELWLRPEDGHVSVLGAGEAALDWLWQHASRG
jgi:pimeloyl-ACP methyl ester carboxylesterase